MVMKKAVAVVSIAVGVMFFGACAQQNAAPVKASPVVKSDAVKSDTAKSAASKTAATVKPAAGTAAKPAAAAPAKAGGDTLVVTARLIEIPGKMPGNDLYNYVFIMKYRIVKVEKGSAGGTELLVGVYNPLIPRAQIKDKMAALAKGDVAKFEMGNVHKLTLVKPIEKIWKDAVEDGYMDSDADKYYALRADVAK
jgi:hypothetical protein